MYGQHDIIIDGPILEAIESGEMLAISISNKGHDFQPGHIVYFDYKSSGQFPLRTVVTHISTYNQRRVYEEKRLVNRTSTTST